MIYCIFTNYRNIIAFLVFSTIIIGLVNYNYGLDNIGKFAGEIVVVVLVSFGLSLYLYINAALTNINLDQIANLSKIIEENKTT